MPDAISAITPIDAPIPTPAFAPADKPLAGAALWLALGAVFDVDDAGAVTVEETMIVDDEAEGVGIGSPNFLAIVYFGRSLPELQQSLLLPQHHSRDVAFPLHGVTMMLLFTCASLW
jgi:hypothetical protein